MLMKKHEKKKYMIKGHGHKFGQNLLFLMFQQGIQCSVSKSQLKFYCHSPIYKQNKTQSSQFLLCE